jgi:tetratricopeptide (TPR) repeat protein
MSAAPSPAQVREWSEEVARDPASLAYAALAGAYHREGRQDAALRLCLRGLERHPEHVEGHYLLGLLYRDRGDLVKAHDEWDIALRLDPAHVPSRRELAGLLCEGGEPARALRHVEEALRLSPGDAALERLHARVRGEARPGEDDAFDQEMAAVASRPGMAGTLLLDGNGYVLAGRIDTGGADHAAQLAAALRGAVDDAERALGHLDFGAWKGILIETPESLVHLSPAGDALLAVAAAREVPAGWVVRAAGRLRSRAERFLAVEPGS